MRRSALRQRVTAWIATLAILAAALAPALSQAAYDLSGDASWLEICTAYGVQRIAVDADPQSSGDGAKLLAGHCNYCSFHAGLAVLPSLATASVPSPDGDVAVTAYPRLLPRSSLAWSASRPRAPPATN